MDEKTKAKFREYRREKAYWFGKKRSEETKRKISETKGGRLALITDSAGYELFFSPEHPYANEDGYVRAHRLVMEEHLDRYLYPDEEVHHIDGNRKNNNISNLWLCKDKGAHSRIHYWQGDSKLLKSPVLR